MPTKRSAVLLLRRRRARGATESSSAAADSGGGDSDVGNNAEPATAVVASGKSEEPGTDHASGTSPLPSNSGGAGLPCAATAGAAASSSAGGAAGGAVSVAANEEPVSCTLLLRLLCWNSGANATDDNWGSSGTFPIGLIGISRCAGG